MVGSRNQKDNHRPISILPIIVKIFEKLISQQLSIHFENMFSKFQCGFRKGCGTLHCLLLIIEKWKKPVDNKIVFEVLLTDLSKAFDSISHVLLIAKLHAYRLSYSALILMQDYLQNSKQRAKVGTAYSNWQDILAGVPQGSVLGPTLFNIFLCYLFLDQGNYHFTNYEDDTTPCVVGNNTTAVLSSLTKLVKNYSFGLLTTK